MKFNKGKIEWVVGRGKDGWVNVCLDLAFPQVPKRIDNSDAILGRALTILFEHDALNEVALLTSEEWNDHEASYHCGISHIDHGLEVLH